MTQDDQHFLDVLAEYTKDIRNFTGNVWDETDRHFASVASSIKKSLPESWLPHHARPAPPPPPVHHIRGSAAYIHQVQRWVDRNRALTAAIVAFLGTGAFLLWRENKAHKKKRRAKRMSNGARKEVVVVAGSISSPIVKSLSLDLERRGFIVYIVCTDQDEEQQVNGQLRADIKPLRVDVTDPLGTRDVLEKFHSSLYRANPANNLSLAGLVLIPDLIYPSGPIETITPDLWSDALNAKVLNTIALTQTFLPTVCELKARVLMLTPNIVASLRPPFHSVETSVVSALEGFTASLRGELGTLGIDVCQFKLGTFDYSHVGTRQHLQTIGSPDTMEWSPAARQSYASNYISQAHVGRSKGLFGQTGKSGSSLRELHNAVFDALTQKRPSRVWRVGRGSLTYDLVGNWIPAGLVGWMLGVRRVPLEDMTAPRHEDSAQSWEKIDVSVT